MMKVSLIAALATIVMSCGKHDGDGGKGNELPNSSSNDANSAQMDQFISDFKSCSGNLCEKVDLGWQQSYYDWPDSSPTVMIVDSPPFDLLVVGKYARRTKAVLSYDEKGEYQETSIGAQKLSRGFARLMKEIGSYNTYISAPDLAVYADELSDLFAKETNPLTHNSELHGISTLGFIGEQSPKSPIVVADFWDAGDDLIRTKNFAGLREMAERAGKSLANKAIKYGVKVISMSAGHDRHRFRKMLQSKFPTLPYSPEEEIEALNAIKSYYHELSSIPGVIFVQAGVDFGESTSDDSPIDCASSDEMPNRIRVGRLGAVDDLGLPVKGGTFTLFNSYLAQNARVSAPCYEGYFNVGYKNYKGRPEKSFRITSMGVEWVDFPVDGTSFAAPVATSFFLYKLQEGDWSGEDPLQIRDKHIRMDGMPGIFDPLLYNQTNYLANKKGNSQ